MRRTSKQAGKPKVWKPSTVGVVLGCEEISIEEVHGFPRVHYYCCLRLPPLCLVPTPF